MLSRHKRQAMKTSLRLLGPAGQLVLSAIIYIYIIIYMWIDVMELYHGFLALKDHAYITLCETNTMMHTKRLVLSAEGCHGTRDFSSAICIWIIFQSCMLELNLPLFCQPSFLSYGLKQSWNDTHRSSCPNEGNGGGWRDKRRPMRCKWSEK